MLPGKGTFFPASEFQAYSSSGFSVPWCWDGQLAASLSDDLCFAHWAARRAVLSPWPQALCLLSILLGMLGGALVKASMVPDIIAVIPTIPRPPREEHKRQSYGFHRL